MLDTSLMSQSSTGSASGTCGASPEENPEESAKVAHLSEVTGQPASVCLEALRRCNGSPNGAVADLLDIADAPEDGPDSGEPDAGEEMMAKQVAEVTGLPMAECRKALRSCNGLADIAVASIMNKRRTLVKKPDRKEVDSQPLDIVETMASAVFNTSTETTVSDSVAAPRTVPLTRTRRTSESSELPVAKHRKFDESPRQH